MSEIHMRQFRSHGDKRFEFDSGITIISGPNGSGKTNILEAIYVLATSKSFRDNDEYLTQYDKEGWRIVGMVDGAQREMRYVDGIKSLTIDQKTYKRMPSLKRLPVVLFEPDDLMLIHGSPQHRRRYIDNCITAIQPSYASTLRRYDRIISQRNRLLKTSSSLDEDKLFVWDVLLTEQADKIARERQVYIEQWNNQLSEAYSLIANTPSDVSATYLSNPDTYSKNYKQTLINALKLRHERDMVVGSTSVGPHRDDYLFKLNSKDFVTNASRGEVRSLVLALKQIEATQIEAKSQAPPLLLLDDVFSELDTKRQKYLALHYQKNQVIITTTHHEVDVPTINL